MHAGSEIGACTTIREATNRPLTRRRSDCCGLQTKGQGGGGAAQYTYLCGAEEVLEILRDVAVAVGRRLCQRVQHLRVGWYSEYCAGLPTATARSDGPLAAARLVHARA